VLIVSGHSLFAEGIIHILQKESDFDLIARVETLEAALSVVKEQQPCTVIVDYDEPDLRDAKMTSLLIGDQAERQIIFLTLAGNRMIIHQRQQVEDATPADLLAVLRKRSHRLVAKEDER